MLNRNTLIVENETDDMNSSKILKHCMLGSLVYNQHCSIRLVVKVKSVKVNIEILLLVFITLKCYHKMTAEISTQSVHVQVSYPH